MPAPLRGGERWTSPWCSQSPVMAEDNPQNASPSPDWRARLQGLAALAITGFLRRDVRLQHVRVARLGPTGGPVGTGSSTSSSPYERGRPEPFPKP